MIGYTTVGTNNLPRAAGFYDALFAVIGAKRLMEFGERGTGWGISLEQPLFSVMTPFDQKPATVGNGTMISFAVKDKTQVEAVHAKALALGGKDEGAPGFRGGDDFYACYFRDLDGNKLGAFCIVGK